MYLVAGARGNVGAEVVRALAAQGEQVRALTRSDDVTGLPVGAEVVHGDLDDPATLTEPLTGVEGVFLLPGYADMTGLLEQIRRSGVGRVVLLSASSVVHGDDSNAVTAYMMRSEQAVRDSGLDWTFLRSYAFMSNALRWLPDLGKGDVVHEPFADTLTAVLDPFDIGAVAAAALTEPGHGGQAYVLSGPEALLPSERLQILAEVLGRPLRLEPLSNDDAHQQMSAEMPADYVDAFFDYYVSRSLDESVVLPTVTELLGRDPRTFSQWAGVHAEAFG